MVTYILIASLVLQFVAVIFALRLIKITGKSLAWGLIAAAIVLMAFRRGISLVEIFTSDHAKLPNMNAELVALAISALMVVGIERVTPIFRSLTITANRLRESEARVRLLLDSTAEGIFGVDPAAKCTFCNHAALKMLGRATEQDVVGTDILAAILHTQADGVDKYPPLAALHTGENCTINNVLLWRADGSSFPADMSSYPMRSNGAIVGAVISFHDITESKQAEQTLANKALELEHSNAELEQFAYVASHDLQEPLRMVSSYTQLLARRYKGKLDQDADDFIAYAVEGATRMQRLINDLLTFSRVASRGKPFEPVDLNRMLQETLEDLQIALEESGATITHDELPTVQADPSQLHHLLLNLLGNAIKFHGAQKPEVHVGARRQDGEWLFSVRDNGIGIAPEYFERIFVIFQRLHSREEYPGTGIGLAVCKRIVERHHGRIWVESEPGQGCTFWFTIPVAEAS
ncbi:MAG: ATP-binding protein [Sulfuricellaceae bacterium]